MDTLSTIADTLTAASPALPPSVESIDAAMSTIYATLFPENGPNASLTKQHLQRIDTAMLHLIERSIVQYAENAGTPVSLRASSIVAEVTAALPRIQQLSRGDIDAALRGDPAARDAAEVIRYYPGFKAIFYHRIAHLLHGMNVPYLPRGITEVAHTKTGIGINPAAIMKQITPLPS